MMSVDVGAAANRSRTPGDNRRAGLEQGREARCSLLYTRICCWNLARNIYLCLVLAEKKGGGSLTLTLPSTPAPPTALRQQSPPPRAALTSACGHFDANVKPQVWEYMVFLHQYRGLRMAGTSGIGLVTGPFECLC